METNEFNFTVNVAGVQAAEGTGGGFLPKGYYVGRVKSVKAGQSNAGAPRLTFQTEVADGEYAGVIRTWGQNIPTSASPQDKNRTWFRTVLLSMAYTQAEVERDIQLTPSAFVGRPHYFFYEPKDPAMGVEYDNVRTLTPDTWQREKAAFESNPANRGISGSGATPMPGFGSAPSQNFTAPTQGFGAPTQGFSVPAPAPAPAQGFGTTFAGFGAPAQAPAQGFGAPTQANPVQAAPAPGGGGMSPDQLMALLQGQRT